MPKKNKGKRKNRGSSDGSTGGTSKVFKTGGPAGGSEDSNVAVSQILNWTNSILYDDEDLSLNNVSVVNDVFNSPNYRKNIEKCANIEEKNMATSQSGEPSLGDIMKCLEKIDTKLGNMESKISGMEKRLSALEVVRDKVDKFDKELQKLWNVLDDRQKKTNERIMRVEERVESQDFECGLLHDKVVSIEKEKDLLREEVVYLQSQSMRNNLVFSNIPEAQGETADDAETKVRQFLVEQMKLANDLVDKIVFDRVHRMGQRVSGKERRIVARFRDYKDKEFVRKQGKALKGTNFFVSEQFPKEIVDKRRKLVPKMKAVRQENKRAWIAYDTLFIEGKPVRD